MNIFANIVLIKNTFGHKTLHTLNTWQE